MATYQAIAAVSAAIRGVLASAAIPEIAGAEFQVVNADSLQSPMADGVAVFLYRVTESAVIRTRRTLDLHYLINAWSADPIRQQLLLGWAIQVLDGTSILTPSLLNAASPGVFQPDESVQLMAETLAMQDESALWNAVRALQQPSAAYLARGVRIG
ncbi:MAG: hypothetical protein JWP63_6690 [Candidatus Solibacter sp.]|nr:hypothetical protein [Candidatus Solibacter sp.]